MAVNGLFENYIVYNNKKRIVLYIILNKWFKNIFVYNDVITLIYINSAYL